MRRGNFSTLCLLMILSAVGCTAADSQFDSQRARYMLEDEPLGAVGVLDLRESISGEQNVVVVGQIGGTSEPWSQGEATFVIADPIAMIEGEGHPELCDCPFCRKATEESEGLALVQFLDERGRILPVDARQLFDVAKNQMVVVRGRARLDELGYLIVSADGLYVRR